MGTSGLCPKSCKRFGVKNVRGENLWAKIGGSGQRLGGSGQRLHFVLKANFRGQKNLKKCIMNFACINIISSSSASTKNRPQVRLT